MSKSRIIIIIIIIIIISSFGVGIWTSWYLNLWSKIVCNSKNYQYINPLLACDEKNFVVEKRDYGEFKSKLLKFIKLEKEKQDIKEAAIYFRDLNFGPTLGINEHTNFYPASLFKVPYLMTYLKLAENQPDLLNKKLKFTIDGEDPIDKQSIKPAKTINENTAYTIEELLRTMIVYSDNRSLEVLENYIRQISPPDEDLIYESSYEMGIISSNGYGDQYVSVKSYASIFRLLYNLSYLNEEMSEKALSLLAETDYNRGLVAGVPAGIKVAHKFGEYWGGEQGQGLKQFHDCGIVYFPGNPYSLCVMTRGYDYDQLAHVISTISKMFYEEFNSRKIK